MKKAMKMMVSAIILIFSMHAAHAVKKLDSPGDQRNVIKIKPIALAINTLSLQYERVLNEKMTIASDLDFLSFSFDSSYSGSFFKYNVTGFGISPEFRYYPGHKKVAPRGFFMAPFLEYYSLTLRVDGRDATSGDVITGSLSGSAVGGGGLLGWQWIIGEVLSIDLNIGVRYLSIYPPKSFEYTINGRKHVEAIPSFGSAGITPAGNVAFGFAF